MSGTVRVQVTPQSESGYRGGWNLDVIGHVPPGLAALVELGDVEYIDDDAIRRVLWAVEDATRVTVLGSNGSAVARVVTALRRGATE